ncbi:MAG: hypothetical protein ACI4IQ_03180 [Eubacterium sp.]
MYLIINEETLSRVWSSSTEFWFSRVDYQIHSSYDLASGDDACLVKTGFIPFLSVSNEEVIRAYINSLGKKKVSEVFANLPQEEYVETFWKYFNAYPEIEHGYAQFEADYVLKKTIEWCEANAVEYKIEK